MLKEFHLIVQHLLALSLAYEPVTLKGYVFSAPDLADSVLHNYAV